MLPLSEMRSASIWHSVILSDRLRLGLGSTPQTVVRFMIYPTEKNPTGISSGSDAYRIFFLCLSDFKARVSKFSSPCNVPNFV